jgi:pyruvate-formate lyase-activating enzyme
MKFLKRIIDVFQRAEQLPVPEFPSNILLEPTNACNLRCRMCPAYGEGVQKKRDIGFMQRDVWKRAIDEIGSWPSTVNLDIHGAGEPLLHPDFIDIVSYAKSKNNISLGFLCNGTLLDRKKSKSVIELGVDWVCFSVDGAEKEIFEYYRKGAVLQTVEENIEYLLSLKINEKPLVSLNMVNHPEADTQKYIDKWAGCADTITISRKRPICRDVNRHLKLLQPCSFLYRQLAIGWTGVTGLCCEDYWIEYATGEFPAQSLYDIWHGKVFGKARKLHETGRYNELYLCRTCDATIFHSYEERNFDKDGKRTFVREELTDINQTLAVLYS